MLFVLDVAQEVAVRPITPAFRIAATHIMSSGSTGMRGTTSPCHSHSAADHVAKRDSRAQRCTTGSSAYQREHSLCCQVS